MKYTITFYVGTERDKYNAVLDPGFVVMALQDARELLLKRYDGYTETDTSGGWLNPSGNVITEDGVKWEVLVEYPSASTLEAETHTTATDIALLLNQASVLYSITPVTLYGSAP